MKNTIFCLLISMTLLIISCEEDDNRGQFSVDSIPPNKVTDISVQNEKGQSILTYTNPTNDDLLYVEAKYTNSLGNETVVRSSSYTNTMKLNGFLRSTKVPVKVYAVDKSLNLSEVTQVEIEPLDNTMFDVFESITYQPTFGGITFTWENLAEQDLVLEFLTFNQETNTYSDYENVYSKAPSLKTTIRGLESIEANFGVVVRDGFKQRTDTLKFTTTPFFEEEIDPALFRELPHHPDFSFGFTSGFRALFNGNTGKESYTVHGKNISLHGNDGDKIPFFTMNLGEEIKLSRFKMWTRNDFIYTHSHPRHILLVGTNDPLIANNATSDTGWETIGEWIDEKPSGGSEGDVETDEDLVYFNSGMDFNVDPTKGSYKYIRFVSLESWGKIDRLWIAELKFWGERQNN